MGLVAWVSLIGGNQDIYEELTVRCFVFFFLKPVSFSS